jgi:TonB-dependent SusC/RagA subfamily outer membrane receptor
MRFKAKLLVFCILICSSYISFGQKTNKKITITGTVLDADKRPIKGATVFIDRIKTDVLTNSDGKYKVKVNAAAKDILIFTLLNGSVEAKINGRTTIDFVLFSSNFSEGLGEAKTTDSKPVNVENGTSEKKNLTNLGGNVVNGQNPEFASAQTIFDMIRGRFPGVEVSGTSIKISGSSSLNVSTEPTFVVDGVFVNDIGNISPQNVKSIEVLKGSAASVYGMRGANGVIVINLLTGKEKSKSQ